MKINNYKSYIFITIASYKDGHTLRDSFASLENAKEYLSDVLMKQDDIEAVEILELRATAIK